MTPDDVRNRVMAVMQAAPAIAETMVCPACKGQGVVERSRKGLTHADVAAAIGVGRTAITGFLTGRQTLTMDKTLRLLEWLDEREAAS